MNVFITGGSGFVGRALGEGLVRAGHQVSVLTRSQPGSGRLPLGVTAVVGDPTLPGPWQDAAAQADLAVNLAGASIFGRWTPAYKDLILQSRVWTTTNLVEALGRGEGPKSLLSTSAVGFYGFHGDEELTEKDPSGDGFLAEVSRQWEAAALGAEKLGVRVVITRFGIVLGPDGGALAQMLPLFRLGLGGPLGDGRQWFSWIHRQDLVNGLLFLAERNDLTGAFNLTSPGPVTNREFAKALGRALSRPAFLPAPGFAVRLALGEFGSVLLKGQRVLPTRLTNAGFKFLYPQLDQALSDLVRRTPSQPC
ncbi:MAG: TIGR01777 family oxidoreductase [Deltaproteobacteria bacterium]|nr:TIGR01777 family oxidoreductase [Deltaproteobacteria bacterium]